MLNKVLLLGRLTSDVELKHTPSNVAVCSFTLAVKRRFNKDTTDFIDCVAWRNTAEHLSKYFSKGQQLVACGALETRTWTDKDGNKRKAVEVNVDEVHFADSKKTSNEPVFAAVEDDEDEGLPF